MRNPYEGLLLSMALLFVFFICLFDVPEMIQKKHTNPSLVKKFEVEQLKITRSKDIDVPRIRQTALFEGPVIVLPEKEYLIAATKQCDGFVDFGHCECKRTLREITKGEEDVNSLINPIYGRGNFTDEQLAYVRYGGHRTMELLKRWEEGFLQVERSG